MEVEKLNPTHEEVVEFAKEEAKYQNTDVDTFLKQAGVYNLFGFILLQIKSLTTKANVP